MAAPRAARTIRCRLAGLAARLYQVREADVAFGGGMVRVGAQTIPFERLTRLAFTERVSLSATGYYATPKITWDRDTASGRPFLYFAAAPPAPRSPSTSRPARCASIGWTSSTTRAVR